MPLLVLPLKAILFQLLFLLITIAIESFILQKTLYLSPQITVKIAMTTNLVNAIINWVLLLACVQLLTPPQLSNLISYIFFNQYPKILTISSFLWAFLTFGLNLLFKLICMKFTINFWLPEKSKFLSIREAALVSHILGNLAISLIVLLQLTINF